eukprot:CAMPEP_0203757416 /NCGR_PEP_ID=MMETSP0098-20131031/10487_1 /ASSEMBLY_ACC=CAM_ASM_000208 /TAXON_ID=96639 /ORGANISM=" , Strain NY0313808BC1" /LENGTH=364 /DNA_ID=CAMNT_0050649625 /DNA_START=204 /DNA_END=1298 /DNA_ORIENTATION=+
MGARNYTTGWSNWWNGQGTDKEGNGGNATPATQSGDELGDVKLTEDTSGVDLTSQGVENSVFAPSASAPVEDSLVQQVTDLVDPTRADLGWGPVDMITSGIDFMHTAHGLPWWGSIIAMTLAFRVALFPLTVFTMTGQERMKTLQPEMKKMQEQAKEPGANQVEIGSKFRKLQAKHGVKVWHMLVAPVVQLPLFLSMFWALKGMAVDYPSMATGGTLWFTDLSIPDPTYGLAVYCAGSFLLMGEVGLDNQMQKPSGGDESTAKNMKTFMRVMALLMIPLSCTMPTSVTLYWCTTNTFSLMQSGLFKIPGVKPALGIKPLFQTGVPQTSPIADLFKKEEVYLGDTPPSRPRRERATRKFRRGKEE